MGEVLVLGGSVAGLLAAAAVAGSGRTVTVVDRDRFPAGPDLRPGVPQGAHQHVLLHRGLLAAERLLPGLRADLLRAGAVPVDTGDLLWLGPSGWLVRPGPEYRVLAATRPLFEHVLRQRVAALPGVTFAGGREARGLSADAGRVTGVRTADGGVLPADLVVDATGRTSRLPDWLAGIGLPAPAEEVVDARIGYASRLYRADRSWFAGAGMFVLATPETGTGGSVLPVEGGRWLVAAVGVGDRRPPRDQAGFHAFLAGLRDPALAEFVSVADPAGPISWYRRTANRRRRYERMRAWPAGLLVLGDALCAFNPIYGQGITVAALQAIALAAVPAGAERALLRRFARLAALPWTIATGEDLRFPTARGRQNVVQAQFGRYARALDRLATHGDVDARRATAAVYQLMASPARLLHPRLVTATARAALRGYGDPVPRPAVLDRQHARSRGE